MTLLNNIKRIIVFGCSYATGEEILYHELGSEIEELRKISANDPRIFFNAVEKNNLTERLKQIQQNQFDYAWPAKLASLLGVECVNLAESGNSMPKMIWQFLNYQDNILETDLVLFSQTKAERNLFFREFPMSFQITSINGPIKNTLLGISETGNVSSVINEKVDTALMSWFNDDRIVWDFISALHSISYFKQSYNVFLVPAMTTSDVHLQPYNKILFEKQLQNFDSLYLGCKYMDSFREGPQDNLLWGHPSEAVHDKFAQHLYSVLHNE